MTHMRVVIDRDTADVELDYVRLERLEFFFFASEGIVKPNHCILFSAACLITY